MSQSIVFNFYEKYCGLYLGVNTRPLNTHLIREICHNENEAKSEAGDMSSPLHVDLPTHCSRDMIREKKKAKKTKLNV